MALMVAPSSAAQGGNSANAALCQPGGYPGALLAQDGSAFKNAGQCTSYGAHGGQIAGVNAVAEPASGGVFTTNYSGFGLKPNSGIFLGARYQPSGISYGNFYVVGENGEFSISQALTCETVFGKVGTVDLEATTATGTVFVREFPPPSGC